MSYPPKPKPPTINRIKINKPVTKSINTSTSNTILPSVPSIPPLVSRSKTPTSLHSRPVTAIPSIPNHSTKITTRESINKLIYTYLLQSLSNEAILSNSNYLITEKKLAGGIKLLEEKVGEKNQRKKLIEELNFVKELEDLERKSGNGIKLKLEKGVMLVGESKKLVDRVKGNEVGDEIVESIYTMQLELDKMNCELSRIKLEEFPGIEVVRENLINLITRQQELLASLRNN